MMSTERVNISILHDDVKQTRQCVYFVWSFSLSDVAIDLLQVVSFLCGWNEVKIINLKILPE